MYTQFAWGGGSEVNYSESAQSKGESPDENWETDRTSITRVYFCDWLQRKRVPYTLLGWPSITTDAGGGKFIKRNVPHYQMEWLLSSDGISTQVKPFLYCTKVKIGGLAPATTLDDEGSRDGGTFKYGKYKTAKVTATYETLPFDIKGDSELTTRLATGGPDESGWERYVMKIVRPTTEFFTVPAGVMRQVGSGNPIIQVGVAKQLSFYNLQVTWYQVPELCVPCKAINASFASGNNIEDLIGTVNSTTFNGYTEGQLLLLAAELKPYRSPFGVRLYDITYMFKFFKYTHQKIYRGLPTSGGAPGWYEVTTTVDDGGSAFAAGTSNFPSAGGGRAGVSIYDWKEFRNLFRPGT